MRGGQLEDPRLHRARQQATIVLGRCVGRIRTTWNAEGLVAWAHAVIAPAPTYEPGPHQGVPAPDRGRDPPLPGPGCGRRRPIGKLLSRMLEQHLAKRSKRARKPRDADPNVERISYEAGPYVTIPEHRSLANLSPAKYRGGGHCLPDRNRLGNSLT